jgi:hypothetical protein
LIRRNVSRDENEKNAMTTRIKATDEGRIRKVIETWADALRNKNANGVLFHYAPHPVHFSLAPPLLSTPSNSKSWNAWFATWEGPIGYEIRDLTVAVGDDVAVDDEWKIAHEHESALLHGSQLQGGGRSKAVVTETVHKS